MERKTHVRHSSFKIDFLKPTSLSQLAGCWFGASFSVPAITSTVDAASGCFSAASDAAFLPRSLRSRCDLDFLGLGCWPLVSSALGECVSATGVVAFSTAGVGATATMSDAGGGGVLPVAIVIVVVLVLVLVLVGGVV